MGFENFSTPGMCVYKPDSFSNEHKHATFADKNTTKLLYHNKIHPNEMKLVYIFHNPFRFLMSK